MYGHVEEPSERSHVVGDFVHQAVNNGEIRILTNGEEMRQFIHVDDVTRALHIALSDGLEGVYDITSFEWVTIIDVAKIIAEFTGARVIPGERTGSTPITPIKGKIPNWLPRVQLREGLKKMIDSFPSSEKPLNEVT